MNFVFKLNESDTCLYFLTVEKVAISRPTECLRNPTSGSVLICHYPVFSRHDFQKGYLNQFMIKWIVVECFQPIF